jgi:hypothetical protein
MAKRKLCTAGKLLVFALASVCGSCFGSQAGVVCNRSDCVVSSNSYGDALLAAGSAGAVFAVAGCTVNGCEMPYTCNRDTKRCERLQCYEARGCPGGFDCDLEKHVCY